MIGCLAAKRKTKKKRNEGVPRPCEHVWPSTTLMASTRTRRSPKHTRAQRVEDLVDPGIRPQKSSQVGPHSKRNRIELHVPLITRIEPVAETLLPGGQGCFGQAFSVVLSSTGGRTHFLCVSIALVLGRKNSKQNQKKKKKKS